MYHPGHDGRKCFLPYAFSNEFLKIFGSLNPKDPDDQHFVQWFITSIRNHDAIMAHPQAEPDMEWTEFCVRWGIKHDMPGAIAECITEYLFAMEYGFENVRRALLKEDQANKSIDLFFTDRSSVQHTVQVKTAIFFGDNLQYKPKDWEKINAEYTALFDTVSQKCVVVPTPYLKKHFKVSSGLLSCLKLNSLHFFNFPELYTPTKGYTKNY
jgi:hypothetical protein